jgi:transketolase
VRKACLLAVRELAEKDPNVVFIGSDITRQNLEGMAADFPDRYFMEGIYEQHVIGMAAGMAMCGKKPYINTIATFLTRRCFDQIVVDVCLHDLPVRLLASGGGTVYAPLGPTHIAIEDLAILRAIPNMTVVAPCDAEEMTRLMFASLDWPGPLYVRIAKGGDQIVSRSEKGFSIGKGIVLHDSGKGGVLIVTTGITAQIALASIQQLENEGICGGILHMHTLKPLDHALLHQMASRSIGIITIEEHTLMGGLGSAVLESLSDGGISGLPVLRLGFPDVFTEELGSQTEIMDKYGISTSGVVEAARKIMAGN